MKTCWFHSLFSLAAYVLTKVSVTVYAGGTMYSYLQYVQSYIAPPVTVVSLLGIFSKRVDAIGAVATLHSGLAIAAIRLSLEVFKDSPEIRSSLYQIADMNFLKFSLFIFLYCIATTNLVSIFSTTAMKKPSVD